MDRVYMKIKQRRLELGMTQKELATLCGYRDHTTINKMENGSVDITIDRLRKIASVLNTTAAELLSDSDDIR